MAHVHALKLTGTIAGSGWTDTGSAGSASSQSSVLSGTQLTQTATSVATGAEANISSTTTYDFRNSVLQLRVVSKTDNITFFAGMDFGSSNRVRFFILEDGTLEAYKVVAGTDTLLYTAAWDSTTYAWMRFRYFETTLHFESSTDGISWTSRDTDTISFTPSAGTVFVGTDAGGVMAGTVVVDLVNVPLSPLLLAVTAATTTAAPGRDSNGDITVSFPTDYTPTLDDLAVVDVYNDQGDASTPTGYAEPTGSPMGSATPKQCVFTDTLAGGESAPVTTISGSTSGASHCANMEIWWGCGSVVLGSADAGTGTPMTAPQITTSQAGSWVVFSCGRGDNETSSGQTFNASATGVTEIRDAGTSAGNDAQCSAAMKFFASASTATGAGASTTSATDPWIGYMREMKAAVALTHYTITASGGTYSLSGTAAGLLRGLLVGAASGSYALTGSTAALLYARIFQVDGGVYTITGTAASLAYGFTLVAESGTYTITGSTVSFQRTYILTADGGSYVISGTAAGLLWGHLLTAGAGSYDVTGSDANLLYGRAIAAASGSYAITGTAAALLMARVLTASAGSYALTGSSVGVIRSYILTAGSGSYSITGSDLAFDLDVTLAVKFLVEVMPQYKMDVGTSPVYIVKTISVKPTYES